jgi:AraC family transcriptional regulator, regulatory protein of adaptative response / DNA-3-methyladenine glycosylase II
MLPDHDTCYRIIVAKDVRFDGRLFIGVKTTGIYCRPICPARTPKSENLIFYPSAAAAQEGGFRPCLRCRPETAPDTPAWRGTSATIGRALRLIEEGALDDHSVEHLAMRLGMGDRQLRRLFHQHVGATPISVAQTRRVLLAKQLLHETSLPISQIALASGFGSIRRFNEVFLQLFQRPPIEIRRATQPEIPHLAGGELALKLRFRQPYNWDQMLAFLQARLIKQIEVIEGQEYSRSFELGGEVGVVRVSKGGADWLSVHVRANNLIILPKLIAKLRHAFDLGGDPQTIARDLSAHPLLVNMVEKASGLRLACSWSGFEGVVRAVLGQQISVKAAIALCSRLVDSLGTQLDPTVAGGGPVTRLFPTPNAVAEADLSSMPMPASRQQTLSNIASAFVNDPEILVGDFDAVRQRLSGIKGVGPWTLGYVSLRVLGDVDAFPAGDVALLKAYRGATNREASQQQLLNASDAWRPWRAYAAQHLWTSLA